MKKYTFINLLTLLPLLVGCGNNSEKLRIICPTGAPSLCFYSFPNDKNYTFETNDDPNNIIPQLGNFDVAVLPTNVGVKAIVEKGINYRISSTITFGNVYVASTGKDTNGIMDEGDYIVSFQKNSVPDRIFHYVYGTTLDSSLHYVGSVSDAAKCLKSGLDFTNDNKSVDYVVIAEPAFNNVLKNTPNVSEYADLQKLYKDKSGGKSIFQASIFVRNSVSEDNYINFINKVQNDVQYALTHPDEFEEKLKEVEDSDLIFGVTPSIAKGVMANNRLNIGFKKAYEYKTDIDLFLSLFGIGETDEEIYIK